MTRDASCPFLTWGVQYLDATRFFAPSAWRSSDASFDMSAATAAAALIAACLFLDLVIVKLNTNNRRSDKGRDDANVLLGGSYFGKFMPPATCDS